MPQLSPGTDIRVRAITTGDGPPKPRPRGVGKLLSSIDDIGLAVLRLEQVIAVEKGDSTFYVQGTEGEPDSTEYTVHPWRPDWWPELAPA
jgi:transferase CAF17, mitochondrial